MTSDIDHSKSDFSLLIEDFIISHRKKPVVLRGDKHYHNAYELLLTNSGCGRFFIKNRNYKIQDKTIFIIDESEIHRPKISEKNPSFDRFIIHIKENFLKSYFNNIESDFNPLYIFNKNIKSLKLNNSQYNKLKYITEKLIFESTKKQPGYQSIIHAYLLEMFVMIFRLTEKNNFPEQKVDSSNQKLHQIIEYINNNYKRGLTLKDIAQNLYISKYYLSHFFKKKTGFTVIEFINSRRIIEAQKMLTSTNLNITDIAMNVGFNTLNHFERTFKTINGITPTQYRNINSNNF
ncbi:AraC family transcriptional regulator [Halanaerobium sp. MA284_MarDTE_T2]|uniref:AraC family transcriptional regulator n=1 Tax=Halanaerobium sp. MA284_MarDTE_T2 TaxID=2183913 RepID=UPI000DF20196|nr:AraC family transcriptional regulator [Halanaerobium sp. MA284_MarDTE_T2]RCW48625.1 AraC-like DNA-binding protein [Halanaerobium sp. MA284_MarDTE_T2]